MFIKRDTDVVFSEQRGMPANLPDLTGFIGRSKKVPNIANTALCMLK